MPAALNLLFLAVFALILYGAFLAAVLGALFLFRIRRKVLISFLTLPVFIALVAGWYVWTTRPSAQFADAFGFRPPADVKELQCSTDGLGDCLVHYLHFRATPATVQLIVARGLIAASGSEPRSVNSTPPTWWNPPTSSPATAYTGGALRGSFSSEDEWMIYDSATGDVYFRYIGID